MESSAIIFHGILGKYLVKNGVSLVNSSSMARYSQKLDTHVTVKFILRYTNYLHNVMYELLCPGMKRVLENYPWKRKVNKITKSVGPG